MQEKLKSFLGDDTFFIAILLILISIISFGLGRQSMVERVVKSENHSSVRMSVTQSDSVPKINEINKDNSTNEVVVSKSGAKYHLLTCPGAKQIKDSNKVFFASTDLAEAAGYTPAANCPGLK